MHKCDVFTYHVGYVLGWANAWSRKLRVYSGLHGLGSLAVASVSIDTENNNEK